MDGEGGVGAAKTSNHHNTSRKTKTQGGDDVVQLSLTSTATATSIETKPASMHSERSPVSTVLAPTTLVFTRDCDHQNETDEGECVKIRRKAVEVSTIVMKLAGVFLDCLPRKTNR